jgi:phage repressor protein C with HTH and peptisase S24 domain
MLKSGAVIQQGSHNTSVSGSNNSNIGNIRTIGSYEVGEKNSITGKRVGVPYYDVDFTGGLDSVENDQTANPACYIYFPQYAKAESWVNVTGRSMEPLINHGDMIAIKRLEDWNTYLLYGEVYAIVTDEYRTIKYVRKSTKGDDYLRLIPANNEFDEQDIPKSVVRRVFQILGCAKRIF